MNRKTLQHIAIITLLSSTLNATENSNEFYLGLDTSFINMGDDTIDIRVRDSNDNQKSKKTYKDVTSINYGLKAGYQHFDKNRVEIQIKNQKISTDVGNMEGATIGINYEWAFTSWESGNILPYISAGFEGGKAKFKKFDLAINDKEVDAFGVNFGLGIRYNINEHVDAKIGYIHSNTAFGDFDNDKGDVTDIAQDKVNFGFAYRF